MSLSTRWRAVLVACLSSMLVAAPASAGAAEAHSFNGTFVYDIGASPDDSILVADAFAGAVHAIRDGEVSAIAGLPVPTTTPGSTLNGIAAIGAGNFFATTGGGDLAAGAKLWRVSHGNARMVADIEAFETAHDPDATMGPMWKDPACEFDPAQGFSAGPQSNPYHLTALSGGEALVADAAGNTLLSARTNGAIGVVAVFTPPTADGSGSIDEEDWLELFELDADTTCFVQPVPTSVAIGADGAIYVGELTGFPATPGLSRVWRIDAGARNVTCPSTACTVAFDGLTSVIDLEFGPDGFLYVVEMDANGWFEAAVLGSPAGGRIQRCDVGTGACSPLEPKPLLPLGAIAFDRSGTAWIVENDFSSFSATVRTLP